MIRLTFFGGINEIGGNKILVEGDGVRLFLDFGKSYHDASQYFEEFLNPRVVHGLKDYLELDLVPPENGIYRQDLINILNREKITSLNYTSPQVDAVLLSHGHMDHVGYVSFLDPTIPVYTSSDTLAVLKAFDISRPHSLENEILNISLRDEGKTHWRKKVKREFRVVKDRQSFYIKNVKITPIKVDHSVPGAMMFLIHFSEGNILYSGDFRLSEIPVARQKQIMSFLKKEKIKIFLCEGTRIESSQILREKTVHQKALRDIKKVKGLVVADYSIGDITRFRTLAKIARETKRKFVLPYNYFNYVVTLKKEGIANINLEGVYLYAKKKMRLKPWEQYLLDHYPHCEAEDIHQSLRDYMLVLNFYQIQELIDIHPDKNSYYLRAITEPHSEEMEISEQRFINWVEHFQMQGLENQQGEDGRIYKKFTRAHISGHISGKELSQFIQKIQPGTIIPIHTEHPELFKQMHKNIKMVEKGETFVW